MACSTTKSAYGSNTIDIEDIYGKNKTFSQIDKITDENIDTYKEVLIKLNDWVEENKDKPDLKERFAKRFSGISREYCRIFIKKSLLVFLYRKMIEAKELVKNIVKR